MLTRIARRIARFVGIPLGRCLRRDYVTGFAVQPRVDLERFGDSYGGWVVPRTLLNRASVVYCVGCGENISFDLALIATFDCEVYALDPTPRAVEFVQRVAGTEPRYHFESMGLWDETTTLRFYAPQNPAHVSHSLVNLQRTNTFIEVPVTRLRNIMAQHGHTRLSLLKLDIEGAEYKVLDSVIDDDVSVDVLCVEYDEFHHPIDRGYRSRIRRSLRRLQARGFVIVDACAGNYTLVHSRATPSVPGMADA